MLGLNRMVPLLSYISTASKIFLCDRKPSCSCNITLASKGFRHSAIILDMILYKKLHKEIDRKSSNDDGLDFLGIIAMNVEFREPEIQPG